MDIKFWLYVAIFLYVLCPFDLLPDFFVGPGWIDDLFLLGVLGWYHFVYRHRRPANQSHHGARHENAKRAEGGYHQGSGFEEQERASHKTTPNDPYDVLGIERNASSDEIKAAYRRLVNQYHPDKLMHLGEEFRVLAEKRFKEIQQAYQELKGS